MRQTQFAKTLLDHHLIRLDQPSLKHRQRSSKPRQGRDADHSSGKAQLSAEQFPALAPILRNQLDDYYRYLNALHNSQIKHDSLLVNPFKIQEPSNSDDKGKRWEQHTFEGPVMANIASLEAMKIEVYQQEKELLETLNERLGVHTFVPDSVAAVSAPISTIVPAGLPFREAFP